MSNNLLTVEMINREAVLLFKNSNLFIANMDVEFEGFGEEITIPVKELVLLGAAAIMAKNPTISRRFWAGWT